MVFKKSGPTFQAFANPDIFAEGAVDNWAHAHHLKIVLRGHCFAHIGWGCKACWTKCPYYEWIPILMLLRWLWNGMCTNHTWQDWYHHIQWNMELYFDKAYKYWFYKSMVVECGSSGGVATSSDALCLPSSLWRARKVCCWHPLKIQRMSSIILLPVQFV